MSIDNVTQRMINTDDELLYFVSRYMKYVFDNAENKRNEIYARSWAMNSLNCSKQYTIGCTPDI